jgi:hypothetical protein
MPERIKCVDDRSLLIADHPHFFEINADRRQIFRDIADVLVLGAARQDLATITRSAAVTTSLEADESVVGMITCEVFDALPFAPANGPGGISVCKVGPFSDRSGGTTFQNYKT